MSSYEEMIWKSYLAWYVFVNFSWSLHCIIVKYDKTMFVFHVIGLLPNSTSWRQ